MGLKTPPDKRAFYTLMCTNYMKDKEVIQYDRNVKLLPLPQTSRTKKITGADAQVVEIIHTPAGRCSNIILKSKILYLI